MTEIKTCVFCGNKSKEHLAVNGFRVWCFNCDAFGPAKKNSQDAIEAWNKAHDKSGTETDCGTNQQRFELVKVALPAVMRDVSIIDLSDDCNRIALKTFELVDAVLAKLREQK